MSISHLNNIAVADFSHINGIAKAGIAAVNGEMLPSGGGGGLPVGAVAAWLAEGNADDEGGVYNGTPAAVPAYATGFDGVGQAFSMNGNANSVVTLPAVNLGSAWSVEFWIYRLSLQNPPSMIISDDPSGSAFGSIEMAGLNEENCTFRYIQGGYATKAQTGTFGRTLNWYKVLVNYDGSKIRIYVNNQLLAEESSTHSEAFNAAVFIGNTNAGFANSVLNGRVDDIVFYDSVITPTLNGNLIASFDCSSRLDIENTWHVLDAATPLYRTGSDGVTTNGAWSFNGSDNNIRLPHKMLLGSAYTIEFDLIVDAGSTGADRGIFYNAYNAAADQFGGLQWVSATSRLRWWTNSTNFTTSSGTLPTGIWFTVKLTYDGTNQRIYIDGVLEATSGSVSNNIIQYAGDSAYFGISHAFYPHSPLIGGIDNVKFYNAVV